MRNAKLPAIPSEGFRCPEYPDKKPSLHGVSWLKINLLGDEVSRFMEDIRQFQIASDRLAGSKPYPGKFAWLLFEDSRKSTPSYKI